MVTHKGYSEPYQLHCSPPDPPLELDEVLELVLVDVLLDVELVVLPPPILTL